jgi:hypothetical protein
VELEEGVARELATEPGKVMQVAEGTWGRPIFYHRGGDPGGGQDPGGWPGRRGDRPRRRRPREAEPGGTAADGRLGPTRARARGDAPWWDHGRLRLGARGTCRRNGRRADAAAVRKVMRRGSLPATRKTRRREDLPGSGKEGRAGVRSFRQQRRKGGRGSLPAAWKLSRRRGEVGAGAARLVPHVGEKKWGLVFGFFLFPPDRLLI